MWLNDLINYLGHVLLLFYSMYGYAIGSLIIIYVEKISVRHKSKPAINNFPLFDFKSMLVNCKQIVLLSFSLLLVSITVLLWIKVHITQGDLEGKALIVSWVTVDEPGSSEVHYWSEHSKEKKKADGKVVTYRFFNYTSGFIHHTTIRQLKV